LGASVDLDNCKLQVIFHFEWIFRCQLQLRAGRSLVDLVPASGVVGGHNMDHLCLRVDPFDSEVILVHLEAHGVVPGEVVDRSGADGPGPSMYIHDPEGNMVELKGP